MGRKKNFEPELVLSKAMDLFWQNGYANTSLADLVEHLAINRFSLYSTFGDKKRLYILTLDYYIEHYSLPALQKLSDDSSRLDDLENFFKHFSKMQHTQTSGCFVQNAILELSLADKQVSNAGNKLYAIILDAISQVLSNAQKYNEISKTENITDISYFLLLQIQGISVLGKAKQYVVMKTAVQIIIEYINNLRMKGEKNLLLKS